MNRNEDIHMAFLEECLKYIEPLSIPDDPLKNLSGALIGNKHKKEKDKHILRHESESP
jgi:hypothetical protein